MSCYGIDDKQDESLVEQNVLTCVSTIAVYPLLKCIMVIPSEVLITVRVVDD